MPNESGNATLRVSAYLRDLKQRASARVAALQTDDQVSTRRRGLLCRLADFRLLMPLERVLGVLTLPRAFTIVPGTARWMLGIVNRHGELLPVYDLRGLLLAEFAGSQRRLIALEVGGAAQRFAVAVDEVLGLRHARFDPDGAAAGELPPALVATLVGYCETDDMRIPIVDPVRIEQLPQFSAHVQVMPGGGRT